MSKIGYILLKRHEIRKHLDTWKDTIKNKQPTKKQNLHKNQAPPLQIQSVFNADSTERPLTKQQQNITIANIRNLLKPLSSTVHKLNIKASYTLILTYAAKRNVLNKS